MGAILITSWPLANEFPESMRDRRPELHEALVAHLQHKGIVPMDVQDNIAATDNGFFGAFYEEDLQQINAMES